MICQTFSQFKLYVRLFPTAGGVYVLSFGTVSMADTRLLKTEDEADNKLFMDSLLGCRPLIIDKEAFLLNLETPSLRFLGQMT